MPETHSHHPHHSSKEEKPLFHCEECEGGFDSLSDLKHHRESQHTFDQSDALKLIEKEILHDLKQKEVKRISWGAVSVTVALVVLTILSAVQTAQSFNILTKLQSGAIKPASASASSSGANSTPSSVSDMPNMVGGC